MTTYGGNQTQLPPPPPPVQPRKTNGLATASLVCGILWLCGVGSIVAIVLGILALRQIKQSQEKGRGLAIAGIVLGALGVLSLVAAGAGLAAVEEETPTRAVPVEVRESTTTERQTSTTAVEGTTSTAPPSTTTTTEQAPLTFTAGQYEFADVQVSEDFVGDFSMRTRVTNTGSTVGSVAWTATVFNEGSVVATLTGFADNFEGGSTITVEFVGVDPYGPWDDIEFQVDYEF